MSKTKILLIEDEEDIAEFIRMQGELSNFSVIVEHDGLNGFLSISRERPDLILLDVMLPGMNGLDICRKVKSNPMTASIPIIMISAKGEELDVVLGLELGADDYVAKPFSPKVLFSRIRAVLRRHNEASKQMVSRLLRFGDFVIDIDGYQLKRKDQVIPLTLSEFAILRRLVSSRGKVLTRNQLLDDIQNNDNYIVDRNVDVHIASLRKKLASHGNWIETIRGVGYRFREEGSDL